MVGRFSNFTKNVNNGGAFDTNVSRVPVNTQEHVSVSMFDKFHLMFNFKSKVSRDVFKNKNECQLTSTFYSKMSPQFWLTQHFRKTNNLNNQYAILICNKTINSQSSVSIHRSRMLLQMLKMVAQSIAYTSSPQRETRIRASRVLRFNLLRKWLLIAFCLENPLSHCLTLFPTSLAISDHCLNSQSQRKLQEQS